MRGFHFTAEQLGHMLIYAYRRFYMRWGFMVQEIRAGRFGNLVEVILKDLTSFFGDALGRVFEPLRWGGGEEQ